MSLAKLSPKNVPLHLLWAPSFSLNLNVLVSNVCTVWGCLRLDNSPAHVIAKVPGQNRLDLALIGISFSVIRNPNLKQKTYAIEANC